jgi:hypothetical protein
MQKSMQFPDIVQEQSGHSECRNCCCGGDEVSLFPYRVHHIHDCVIPMGLGEFDYEVHVDGIPTAFWNWEGVEFSNRMPPLNLGPKAEVTCLHLLGDIWGHQ